MAKTLLGRMGRDASKNGERSWSHQDRQLAQGVEEMRDETRGVRRPSSRRKKDTRRWCRGREGVEHDPRWVPSRWATTVDGRPAQTLEEASNWDWTCRECGKLLKWKWNPAKKPAWAKGLDE